MRIVSLVGARPQFVKEALLNAEVRRVNAWDHILVHSGQHYDVNMSDVFFAELGIPAPRHYLGIGSGGHGVMTAAALTKMEEVLKLEHPDALIVYGDTNTTLAGALAAAKLRIPVIHVEAGIRQEPRSMPEELNRRLTDHIAAVSDGLLCCCSRTAVENLAKEGIVHGVGVTGDVMFDLFQRMQGLFSPNQACEKHAVKENSFILTTLHRDFNVDDREKFIPILRGLRRVADELALPILFPVHPRTKARIMEFACGELFQDGELIDPIGYVDLMSLVGASAFVVTDSGGLQKEAYYAGKRAIVVMPDTGWREITNAGWNLLADTTEESILANGLKIAEKIPYPDKLYGDGNATSKIVEFVLER